MVVPVRDEPRSLNTGLVVECSLDREWSNGGMVTIRGKSAVRGV